VPPSRETLQRVAADTGFPAATLETVIRLLELLEAIGSDEILGGKLALKGGTALNLFVHRLDRLSVDIDVNYVGARDRDTMLRERPEVEAALERLLRRYGYQVRATPPEHAGRKWLARYQSALGGTSALEVDINFMHREPLVPLERLTSIGLGDVQAKEVLLVGLPEIVAGKLVALITRGAARDLFDARRILDLQVLDRDDIRPLVLAIGASGPLDWRTTGPERIGGDLRDLRQKLTMCVPVGYFDRFGGPESWLKESVEFCREVLGPMFQLSDQEKAFLDRIEDRGEIDASLLSAAPDPQERIQRMPALAWKCQNRRAWLQDPKRPKGRKQPRG